MFRTLTPTLSILVAILIFVFFVRPTYEQIGEKKIQITEYNDTTAQYSSFNDRVNALLDKKNSVSDEEVAQLFTFLPESIDIPRLLLDIETLTKSNGMIFGNITVNEGVAARNTPVTPDSNSRTSIPNAQSSEPRLEALEATFTVIGTYRQFKDLLIDIEHSRTLMEVTSITLGGDAENSARQTYTVTIRTYALST